MFGFTLRNSINIDIRLGYAYSYYRSKLINEPYSAIIYTKVLSVESQIPASKVYMKLFYDFQ